jgi:hypothetical protein
MTRLWLVRLAPVIFAALQLGIPRAAAAMEFRPARQPTGVAPAFEQCARAVFARGECRQTIRLFGTTPFLPVAPARLFLQAVLTELTAPESPECGESCLSVRQPPARAPPALS